MHNIILHLKKKEKKNKA